MTAEFPPIRFTGELRPSQRDVAAIARRQLEAGERRLHIVAPPGSGKTVVGLYLWAECVRCPALVLSPNSAIQAQWGARTDLFQRVDAADLSHSVSTSTDKPGLLNSLTYQSITLPARADDELNARATTLWIEVLLENNQADGFQSAEVWIRDLARHNPSYYKQRLSAYRKRIRDEDAVSGRALETLHNSARETLRRLRSVGVRLLILDECHHLMGHWGRVLAEVGDYLDDPIIVGLTATPPDRTGHKSHDVERYDAFFGPVDYEVPVPAVVKDGYLAPYQDLAWFVRPTPEELKYIARTDEEFVRLIEDLCEPRHASSPSAAHDSDDQRGDHDRADAFRRESLIDWLLRVLRDKQLPNGPAGDWASFRRRDPEFAAAAVVFLESRGVALPGEVRQISDDAGSDAELNRLVTVLDRYIRHCLRRSPAEEDHRLAERATDRMRMLGVQIGETGHRPCASPVSRVIAYTKSKTEALVPILGHEMQLLDEAMRAVVIADYEKTSAISSDVAHLLDAEAGGAVAAFRAILEDARTNELDPILLTGSTVLADSDVSERLLGEAESWLERRGMTVEMSRTADVGFCVVSGTGRDWCPRVYVELITELFQRGLTRCLVGTRGLLGEGWDANSINVLVDLSTVTTSMTVNQLRGRSIRLNPGRPHKLANNWDVVCIAPEFTRGLDDYFRFLRKHETVFGICDDGAIEKGVGHVHAAFTELAPELLDGSVSALNADMLRRAARRELVYRQWRVGQPYSSEPVQAVEIRHTLPAPDAGHFPPFRRSGQAWNRKSLSMAIAETVLRSLVEVGVLQTAELDAIDQLRVGERDGGFVRVFLERADPKDQEVFADSFREAVGPLDSPRYLIPRYVDRPVETFFSRFLPDFLGRFLRKRERGLAMLHAVPAALGRRRELADVYQKHWNRLVSPGEVVYAANAEATAMLASASECGKLPTAVVHQKEVFL